MDQKRNLAVKRTSKEFVLKQWKALELESEKRSYPKTFLKYEIEINTAKNKKMVIFSSQWM